MKKTCFLKKMRAVKLLAASFTLLLSGFIGYAQDSITIAQWNGYVVATDTVGLSVNKKFLAKEGIASNKNIAALTRDAAGTSFTINKDSVAASAKWDSATTTERYWIVQFSTKGYNTLKVTSKQKGSNTGPRNFKIQYKAGSSTVWTDLEGGTIVDSNDNYIKGVVKDLALPAIMDDQDSVFLRWLCTSTTAINNNSVVAGGVNRLNVTIIGTVKPSNDTTLAVLTVSNPWTLTPAFNSATKAYTVEVPYTTDTITVTPIPTHQNATIENAAALAKFPLAVGVNTITVTVLAEDQISKGTYTVTVTRASLSNDTTLKALSLSTGILNPSFASTTKNYTVEVPFTTEAITVTAAPTNSGATIQNELALTSIVLNTGANLIQVFVLAEDGVSKGTYTITVNRDTEISSDTTLKALAVSGEWELDPVFSSYTKAYTVTVPYEIDTITVTAEPTNRNASIENESELIKYSLVKGNNAIHVVVVAENQTSKGTYTIYVVRGEPSNDTTLKTLTISSGTLTPAFSSETKVYYDTISYATEVITITAEPTNKFATISNPLALTDIALNVGTDTLFVNVLAQDGISKGTYTLFVTRKAEEQKSNDATLRELTVSEGTLSPEFNSATKTYFDTVPFIVDSITLTATPTYRNAAIDGPSIIETALPVGDTTISFKVIAEDSVTTETYTVKITRLPSTGIAKTQTENIQMSIYPNPATEVVFIKVRGTKGSSLVEIFNLAGQKVFAQEITDQTSVNNLSSGIYVVKVTTEKSSRAEKLIVR